MTEKQTSGELFVNGDFATGDFSGWSVGSDASMSVVPNEGRHIAVLKPVPYGVPITLNQTVVRERSDGDYVFGFWIRSSDADGNAVPGVRYITVVTMLIHPRDNLGSGKIRTMNAVVTSYWVKYTWRFSIEGRRNQDFEVVFKNERKRPDDALILPAGRDGYETVIVPNEDPAPKTLNDDDNSPFAIRDVTLFRA
ncbi:hypothetical protein [Pandoraea oxalativorans]|uniref:CBM-cenC domain-containing protein n=1 Tax=Pandoraea oxalativorans TaxID=573737 RepID=A0A0E3YBT4_9BURK|nr:hypothetical protein [Pandoraea oxalativorans]AKC70567.1 hypothetical protein MB84_15340 [Pandoraea oxalativorans]